MEELDKSWDAFKKVTKQHKHLSPNGLVPVHAVRVKYLNRKQSGASKTKGSLLIEILEIFEFSIMLILQKLEPKQRNWTFASFLVIDVLPHFLKYYKHNQELIMMLILYYNVQVLNGLPEGWGAEVVASLDDQFGIIKISSVTRDRELAPGVSFIYAMFHIEDVYDMAGVPAILNPNIAMNCHVNLTARQGF